VDLHARHHRRSQGHEMILEKLNLVALVPGLPVAPARRGRGGSQVQGAAKRHRVATPKAPLTWERRPRRLRSALEPTHGNDTRAQYLL
jgi:hypothetical protein